MNRHFVVKMMQAKQMEYQALKEIMPECMVNRVEKVEDELIAIAKEYFVSMMNGAKEDAGMSGKAAAASRKNTDVSREASDTQFRKVTID